MFCIKNFENYLTDFQKNILNEISKHLDFPNDFEISFSKENEELLIANKTIDIVKNIIIFDCEIFAISIIGRGAKKCETSLNFYKNLSDIQTVVNLFKK
jgi:hypothetical protein